MDDGSKANDYHFSFKCVLVGSQGVGKTTLLDGEVPNGGSSGGGSTTVGINFQLKFYSLKGMTYRVVFWDTPGSERHLKLTSRYAAGSAVAVLVFDVNKVCFGFSHNSRVSRTAGTRSEPRPPLTRPNHICFPSSLFAA